MKPRIETSDGVLGGREVVFESEVNQVQGVPIVDAIGFSKAAIEISCTGAGTSGNATIQQGNTLHGTKFPLATPGVVAITSGSVTGKFDIAFTGRFLNLDLGGVTFGATGRVKITVVLKL